VEITANATASVYIRILDSTGPAPVPDHGPVITSLTASKTNPGAGEAVALAVTAVDVDGDPLTYAWSQDCESGEFTAADEESTSWSSAVAGVCTLTVAVASNDLAVERSVSIVVFDNVPATGAVSVSGEYLPNPTINVVYLESSTGYCFVERTGANATCSLTVRPSDLLIDRSMIVLDWSESNASASVSLSDDCGGTLVSGPVADCSNCDSFALSWRAPPTPAVCVLTARVTRDAMTDEFPIVVNVAGCVDDAYEENETSGTATQVRGSAPVGDLYAHDVDWYWFTASGASATVSLTTTDVIPVALYAADGTLVASGTNGLGPTTVTSGNPYYVRASAGAAAASCGSGYALQIDGAAP
jgi:hypothetical protein